MTKDYSWANSQCGLHSPADPSLSKYSETRRFRASPSAPPTMSSPSRAQRFREFAIPSGPDITKHFTVFSNKSTQRFGGFFPPPFVISPPNFIATLRTRSCGESGLQTSRSFCVSSKDNQSLLQFQQLNLVVINSFLS